MNYSGFALTQLRYNDFITNFEQEYSNQKWTIIQERINRAMKGVLVAATQAPPPEGVGTNFPIQRQL